MTDLPIKRGALDSTRLWQVLAAGVLLMLALFMLHNVTLLLTFAATSLSYPFSFDYGEGIVWQQMRDMLEGTAYGPLGVFPAIVYHYPPLYHLTAAATAVLTGADQLTAGRAVEVVATLASAVLVGVLTVQALGEGVSRHVRFACATAAALLFLNCESVIVWAPLMRVDMLAGAFGLIGLVLAIRAVDTPRLIHAAAVAFVLSIYTKQVSIAAPMAAFGVMLLADWRTALRGLLTATVLGLIVLAALYWATDGGFVRHIFLYNVNRFAWSRLSMLADGFRDHWPFLLLAAVGLLDGLQRVRAATGSNLAALSRVLKADRAAFAIAVLAAFLAIKTLTLLSILKSGSNVNYFIEWLSAVVIFASLAMRPVVALAVEAAWPRARISLLVTFVGLIALIPTVAAVPVWSMSHELTERAAKLASIVPKVAAASKPVIADDMTLQLRAGRRVQWEPSIAAELGAMGVYDEAAFVRMIRAGEFAFFVTGGRPGDRWFDEHYNPAVQAAIKDAYPVEENLGEFVLHLPR